MPVSVSNLNLEPPSLVGVVDLKTGSFTKHFADWLTLILINRVQTTGFVKVRPPTVVSHAAIGPTVLLAAASAALYRVSWYARITVPDGAGSSLTISILSTDGGQAIVQPGAAITGDSVVTVQSGSVVVKTDGGTNVSYSTAYNSTTPAKMGYAIDYVLEPLS
jgi:hypothetical protein